MRKKVNIRRICNKFVEYYIRYNILKELDELERRLLSR